ncbi:hypothetical protein D3C75_1001560 [compost metagenome]
MTYMSTPPTKRDIPSHCNRNGMNGKVTAPSADTRKPTTMELIRAQPTTSPITISILLYMTNAGGYGVILSTFLIPRSEVRLPNSIETMINRGVNTGNRLVASNPTSIMLSIGRLGSTSKIIIRNTKEPIKISDFRYIRN